MLERLSVPDVDVADHQLQTRPTEKQEFDASEIVPKSLEGRDGRERQARAGAATAKLRVEAAVRYFKVCTKCKRTSPLHRQYVLLQIAQMCSY